MKPFNVLGAWWLPETPDHQVAGLLSWSPERATRLDVVGSLEYIDSPDEEHRRALGAAAPRHHPVVLGVIRETVERFVGREVTLIDCRATSGGLRVPGILSERLHPRDALFGTHFTDIVPPTYDQIHVQIENMWDWVGTTGFTVTRENPFKEMRLVWERPPDTVAEGPFGEKFVLAFSHQTDSMNGPDPRIKEVPWISVQLPQPLQYDELHRRYIRPMQNLVTLGLNHPVEVTDVWLSHPAIIRQSIEGTSLGRGEAKLVRRPEPFSAPAMPRRPLDIDMLFGLQDYPGGWAALVPTWLQLLQHLNDVDDVLFGNWYAPPNYPESHFLSLAQAMEGYHRRRFPDSGTPLDEHTIRLRQVMQALPKEHRTWVNNALRWAPQPTLAQRVEELLEGTSGVLDPLVGDRHRFVKQVVQSRSHYSHLIEEERSDVCRGEALSWLSAKLLWVVRVRLLFDLGFTRNDCEALLARNSEYGRILRALTRAGA